MLNLTRAFGDKLLKKFITAEPYCPDPILIESAEHCPLFILACDGLFLISLLYVSIITGII